MLTTELEILTGKLIRGDITPMVYSLIKDSPFISDIIGYSSKGEEVVNVCTKRSVGNTDNNGGSRSVFEDWLRNGVQSVPIQGEKRRQKPRTDYRRTSVRRYT